MSRYIAWEDKRGRLNILDTVPLDFGPVEDRRHEYEPGVKRYMDGPKVIAHECCDICGGPRESGWHPKERP